MRFETRRRAKDEVIDCLVWYNSRKLYSTLGYTGPMQYEQRSLVGQPKTAKLGARLSDSDSDGKITH